MLPVLAAISLVVAVAGDVYDVTLTSRGLKKGLAVEGNTWLIGDKPSTRALYLRDALVLGFCMVPFIAAFLLGNIPVAIGALASPVVYGIKHYHGGLASWKKLGA